ncbi:hypothetical protein EB796_020095 [Bugula neritina]|uniref:Uncharacterized protein n=1 Tax=Bugula neritina TaxID=10212 RepID=A0A7J7J5U0_BUGNE|nr:hypothetical protein EB796_020095 [Bugula neritina]
MLYIHRYENEERLMIRSHKWQQQQFFISQVFDRAGKIRYSKPSPSSLSERKREKYIGQHRPSEQTSTAKSKSIAALRDGLFKSQATSVPANVLRHETMTKKLDVQEKLELNNVKDLQMQMAKYVKTANNCNKVVK